MEIRAWPTLSHLGAPNILHLDVDGDAFTNLATVAAMTNLTDLEMNGVALPQDISFLGQMVNLNSLDVGNDHVGSLVLLTNLTLLIICISTLISHRDQPAPIVPQFYITRMFGQSARYNAASAVWNVITNLQIQLCEHGLQPQHLATLTVWIRQR